MAQHEPARRLPASVGQALRTATQRPPATPRDAATVVLLRAASASGTGVEVYLLRRVTTMAFAAGMHVFPGGSVDPADANELAGKAGVAWAGPSPQNWASALTASPALALALVCAAVRETFEETGVLLAAPREDGRPGPSDDTDWEADRQALEAREFSLSELLRRRRLLLRTDLIRPWAHWITPEVEPRRYDTRFFVAALPAGQQPRQVGGEADRGVWLRPEDALARHRAGELAMLPPTAFTLAELAEYASPTDVLAAAAARDIRPVLPKIVVSDEEARILLPGDEGYAP